MEETTDTGTTTGTATTDTGTTGTIVASGTSSEGAGGEGGAITGGEGGTGAEGEGGEGGAITGGGDGEGTGGEGGGDAVDYSKMTDDEYLAKVTLPDGQQWDKEVMKQFAPLLRESKISPEVFAKFVAKDAELAKAAFEKQDAEQKRQREEAQAAFKQAGEEFRKEFTPEQVKEMNETMATLKDDATFTALVTRSPLSNNKTMGKMLLAYRQVYGEDAVVGGGSGSGAKKGFAEIWTGKKA
jgi:hypothetical protein